MTAGKYEWQKNESQKMETKEEHCTELSRAAVWLTEDWNSSGTLHSDC